MTFRWKKDNVEIANSPRMHINYTCTDPSKEQISDLHIFNASLNDAGIYQCFASNIYGSVHSGKANVSVVGM